MVKRALRLPICMDNEHTICVYRNIIIIIEIIVYNVIIIYNNLRLVLFTEK